MLSKYVLPLLLMLAGNFSWILSGTSDQGKTGMPTGKLGPLQVTVTNVHHWMLIGDKFPGPSTHKYLTQVEVTVTNGANFPVCTNIHPLLEEYRGLELSQDAVQIVSTADPGLRVKNLMPGKKAFGNYMFELNDSGPKMRYVLVLELSNERLGCGQQRNEKKTILIGDSTVRLDLPDVKPNH
jgi:hypothetical protein